MGHEVNKKIDNFIKIVILASMNQTDQRTSMWSHTLIKLAAPVFITSVFVGAVLMLGWNYGLRGFAPFAPMVDLVHCFLVTFTLQIMSIFLIWPVKLVPRVEPNLFITSNGGQR